TPPTRGRGTRRDGRWRDARNARGPEDRARRCATPADGARARRSCKRCRATRATRARGGLREVPTRAPRASTQGSAERWFPATPNQTIGSSPRASKIHSGATWKSDSEARPSDRCVFGPDLATVIEHDLLHDREPEARPFGTRRFVGLEDPALSLFRDSRPIVVDDEFHRVGVGDRADTHHHGSTPRFSRREDRVLDEVDEHLLEQLAVARDVH